MGAPFAYGRIPLDGFRSMPDAGRGKQKQVCVCHLPTGAGAAARECGDCLRARLTDGLSGIAQTRPGIRALHSIK